MWDLVVVGAGPAGSAAALAALRLVPHARVLLLDRSTFPRDKACGDGIAPHALDVLSGLGVPDAVNGYPAVHRLSLGYLGGPHVERRLARPCRVIPRQVFDARLVSAAQAAGAVLEHHRVRRLEQRPDRVVLDGSIEARVVVAADGADSTLRRLARVPPPPSATVAVALRGYAAVRGADTERQVIAFETDRGWPAYAWAFPIGDGRANVGYGELRLPGRAVTRAEMLHRLDVLLPGAADGGSDWRAHHLPLSTGRPRQPDGRLLFAGDAAALINPMTGEGIYYAVLSGALAGGAAVTAPSSAGRRYRRALDAALRAHLRHTALAARLARSPRVVAGCVRAADRSARVFDDLVELGLGRGRLTASTVAGLGRDLLHRPLGSAPGS